MSRREIIALVKSATGMVVRGGIFAGMRLNDHQTWGYGEDIGPQLLGVYEQELYPFLTSFFAQQPSVVVNVGCAEGYYAVGAARLLKSARVYAFDIDAAAREACRANAILNAVGDRIEVLGRCSRKQLAEIAKHDPEFLAIVDCEGCELNLLTPRKSLKALRHARLVIETHDHLDRRIMPGLVEAFSASHRVTIVRSGARNPHDFPFLDQCSDRDKWLLVCENRPELQRWLVCEPISHLASPPL